MDLYRQRRQRTRCQPILTKRQIRELGHMVNLTSFRQSAEFFMDPFHYFTQSKTNMAKIHRYLLSEGLTTIPCPTTHIRQGDHARLLISILFPGYPIVKASEAYYRSQRENRGPQVKLHDLAYDRLPTTDRYERLEELFRADLGAGGWTCHPSDDDTDKKDGTKKKTGPRHVDYTLAIPLKKLNRSIVLEGHADSTLNVRLFMYLWSSERMAWTPHPEQLELLVDNAEKENNNNNTTSAVHAAGFKHIDMTDTSALILKANRRSTQTLQFRFRFKHAPHLPDLPRRPDRIRHVSVCAVIEKTPEELASQLYLQTAALYMGRALERHSRQPEVADALQKKATHLLNQYDMNDRWTLSKMKTLFLSSAETFLHEWNDTEKEEKDNNEADNDGEIMAKEEVVSVLDPIHLGRIEHPARCIFCTHSTTFDAIQFFRFEIKSTHWRCPICFVQIRGLEDLYMDYPTKLALDKYPDEQRFFKDANDHYTSIKINKASDSQEVEERLGSKRKYDVISLDEDEV
ncbi:hypothetical protein BDF20DRAFT_297121 [Mycotypha africana]|uniref:uncharacterized protein n=1 Tax=Mycotypha africana TaxID=64632 RepID=UPI002300922C|nr:uncharacterized protein BDF20DRAFT_297121 [Mycotypha africana]KAI8987956.1 hypothetical protein BDF20DRAFT_297121 [Mycotypha africana]